MVIKQLIIKSKPISLKKPLKSADYQSRTVLTNSVWEYVELWLRRECSKNADNALFYWEQAKCFYNASECLPIESKPLTAYYCCLNATKALLSIKGPNTINFDNLSHGISSDRAQWKNNNIKNAETVFQGQGTLFELSKYLGEDANKKTYNIYDLLYNIPCIHRAFSITYSCTELFIPVKNVMFIIDTKDKNGWVQFQVDEKYANQKSLKSISNSFEKVKYNDDGRYLLRSKHRFDWDMHGSKKQRLENLSSYQMVIRKKIHYILGDETLWYIKKEISSNKHIIDRGSLTLIFAVMHWMSELVRYNPKKFSAIMKTKQNWLVREFVENALYQFIDEISCEMTNVDIMSIGHRKR